MNKYKLVNKNQMNLLYYLFIFILYLLEILVIVLFINGSYFLQILIKPLNRI